MTFSMMIVAMTLVMWVICLGLAPAWMGPVARSRGLSLRVRLQKWHVLKSRPTPTLSLTV